MAADDNENGRTVTEMLHPFVCWLGTDATNHYHLSHNTVIYKF